MTMAFLADTCQIGRNRSASASLDKASDVAGRFCRLASTGSRVIRANDTQHGDRW